MSLETSSRVLVCGAGGFIGHHLVAALKAKGHFVRGVDLKMPEFEPTAADEFFIADLRDFDNCVKAVQGMDDVYQLAADMGGIGYITANHADIARNNILINAHMLEAAHIEDIKRYLYTSSACVYPAHLQSAGYMAENYGAKALTERDAIPADPEPGYGWEKLFSEQLTSYYAQDHGLDVRIVRFHNVYGPLGTYQGGKEKAPAAVCRKVAQARDSITIWGDGEQTRSFMFIDDCIEGLFRIMASGYREPLNLGTSELVSINMLAKIISEIACKSLTFEHDITGPQGVRGRNSDNTLCKIVLNWEPTTPLHVGLEKTYSWIHRQCEP